MKKGTMASVSLVLGIVTGFLSGSKLTGRTINQKEEKIYKFKSYYTILNQWLILKQTGKNLSEYFINNNYSAIAIYGMGEMGNRLYEELKESPIKVKYGIDREAESVYAEVEVVSPDTDHFDVVDMVVVTSVFAFDKIQKELSKKITCPILSLEDIVYEI